MTSMTEAPQKIEPALELLAKVIHLWLDGYISKNPDSMAPSSISNDTFDEIERFLSTRGISVDYCGWKVEKDLISCPETGQ